MGSLCLLLKKREIKGQTGREVTLVLEFDPVEISPRSSFVIVDGSYSVPIEEEEKLDRNDHSR